MDVENSDSDDSESLNDGSGGMLEELRRSNACYMTPDGRKVPLFVNPPSYKQKAADVVDNCNE